MTLYKIELCVSALLATFLMYRDPYAHMVGYHA